MKWMQLAVFFICAQIACFANSINLFNDSEYKLTATIYDANGTLMGEFVLNPRDAIDWSDDQYNFGSQTQYISQVPYTVNWTCMAGNAYGSCDNISPGSIVTAQSCGGVQECDQQQNGY